MPTPPTQPPRDRPDSGPGGRRRTCRRIPGPPLPDPEAVRLCPIPDSAPPYDDELLSATARPAAPASPSAALAGEPEQAAGRPGPGSSGAWVIRAWVIRAWVTRAWSNSPARR